MPKRDDVRIFDEADVLIIAGRALGMTQEAIGKWLCTPTHPTGVSERTVRNRIAEQQEPYDRLTNHLALTFRRHEEEFKEITKAEYTKMREKLRSKGIRAKELALDQGIQNPGVTDALALAVKVADGLEERDFGKARQVIDHSGEIEHRVVVWTSDTPKQLMAHEVDMDDSAQLLNALSGDVLEAELVADA